MSRDYKLVQATDSDFESVFKIMDQSFPASEMRDYEGQLKLLKEPNYKLHLLKEDGLVKAFLGVWEFKDFDFVEHFAVEAIYRGGGTGSKVMQEYLKQCKKVVLLEVEEPNCDIAKRRVGFYERLNFHFSEYKYLQPMLQTKVPEEENVMLHCMTYPTVLNEENFIKYRDILFREVYKVSE